MNNLKQTQNNIVRRFKTVGRNISRYTVQILIDPNKVLTGIIPQSKSSFRKNSYADEIKFNIQTANRVLPTFNRELQEIKPFLTFYELLNDSRTKKGKTSLSNSRVMLNCLIRLEHFCHGKTKLIKWINTKKNTVNGFRDKILDLNTLLNEIQISQSGESQRDAIIQSNDGSALSIF